MSRTFVYIAGPSSPEMAVRLRISMRTAINDARRREEQKAKKGRVSAKITVTLDEVMAKLKQHNYCCAITGLPFWQDDAVKSYRPTSPSIDRLDPNGDYSNENTRVVLYGVNSLRGCGSDADMIRIARAIAKRATVSR